MSKYNIRYVQSSDKIEIIITPKYEPYWVNIIPVFIAVVCFTLPIYLVSQTSREEIRFTVVISFILLYTAGVYLARLVLWNIRGKEVISITTDHVYYQLNKGFGTTHETSIPCISLEMTGFSENDSESCFLEFKSGNDSFKSVFFIRYDDFKKYADKIKDDYTSL